MRRQGQVMKKESVKGISDDEREGSEKTRGGDQREVSKKAREERERKQTEQKTKR